LLAQRDSASGATVQDSAKVIWDAGQHIGVWSVEGDTLIYRVSLAGLEHATSFSQNTTPKAGKYAAYVARGKGWIADQTVTLPCGAGEVTLKCQHPYVLLI
jgi:hypothetical protein